MSNNISLKKLQTIQELRSVIRSALFEQNPAQNNPTDPLATPVDAGPFTIPADPPPTAGDQAPPMATDQAPQATAAPVAYSLEELVAGLNKIRAGRSFDDKEVYQQLETMFSTIDDASKASLKSIIEKIIGIVTPLLTAIEDNTPPAEPDASAGEVMNQAPSAPTSAVPAAPAAAEAPAMAPAMPAMPPA